MRSTSYSSRLIRAPAAYLIVVIAFGLLMFRLDAKSLSGDEFGNVQIESGTLDQVFMHMADTWSQHPPVSHILMNVWIGLTGTGDFTVRFPAVFWSVIGICLFFKLTRRWFGVSIGLTAMLLLAVAPDLILYGRMEKYYSLVMALVLASILLFDRTIRRPRPILFVLQGIASLIILYTDYFAALFVVGAQNLIALLLWRRDGTRIRQWLLPQIAALILFLPIAGIVMNQARLVVQSPEADLASGWLAVAAKLLYFPYAYSVGETIFPWSPTAIIGVGVYSLLALIGLRAALKSAKPQPLVAPGAWAAVFFAVPAIGSIILTSTILKTVPLITLPNHVFFALPFFLLLVALGLQRSGRWRAPLAALAIVLLIPSLFNYYTDQQFHNPVFVTPSRDVLAYVVRRSRPGDVLIQDIASGVGYYYEAHHITQPRLIEDQTEILSRLTSGQFERVWLVSVGRDRTRQEQPDPITTWLEHNLRPDETTGFAEQDATYRAVKAKLTGRPAYPYRVVVQLFVKP